MSQDLLWTHETGLAPVTTSASEARAFVEAHLVEHGLSYLVEDVRLVVSELADATRCCTPARLSRCGSRGCTSACG